MKRSKKADITPSELAEMVRLKEAEGLTHSQIANRFNLSPSSVKGLLKGVQSKAEADRLAEAEEFKASLRTAAEESGEPCEDLQRFSLKAQVKSDG